MAVTTENYSIDLCPIKPDKKLIDLGDTTVKIQIAVETKKPTPPVTMRRLKDKAVEPVAKKYQATIQKSVNILERKVKELAKANDAKNATIEANALNHSVQSACKSLQAAVDEAVRNQLKADAKADKNLAEAKVKVGISVGFHVVIALADVARIGGTLGADVQASTSLFMQVMDLAEIVNDQFQKAPKLLADLRRAYDEYLRTRIVKEQAKTSSIARTERLFDQVSSGWKSKAAAAEEARRRFRDEVTSLRQNLEKMSKQTAKVEQVLNSPGGTKVKDLAKAKQKVKKLRSDVDKAYGALTLYEQNLDNMSKKLVEAFKQHGSSTKVDDRTFGERFGKLETVEDLALYGGELLVIAGEIVHMGAG